MQQVIPAVMPLNDLAPILGILPRTVLIRARKENWHLLRKRGRGGFRYEVLTGTAPDYLKEAIAGKLSTVKSSLIGFKSGLALKQKRDKVAAATLRAKENGLESYNALPKKRKAECDAKFEILKMRDAFIQSANLPLKRGSELFVREIRNGRIKLENWIEDALPKRKGQPAISWPSLNRWQKAYDEFGLAGLASGHGTTKATTVPLHMQLVLEGMIYDHPHAVNKTYVMGLQAKFPDETTPSASAIRRWVRKWKEDNASLFLMLTNPDEWKSRHMFAIGNASENITRLNQLWEMDSTPADIMLTDGRYNLIGVIDIYSRRLKLLVSPTSKATAVAALIRRAIVDWGIPEAIKTDNGKDYVAKHIARVLDGLKIDQVICDPFKPEQKPHIERVFHTFSHGLLELMPGYIGHNVAEQQAIRARKTFAARMMNRKATVEVRMTAAELQTFCDDWVEAFYHQDEHDGLKGKTPAQVAREWTDPVHPVRNERALDMLLCPAPKDGGMRTITKEAIVVDKIDYVAPEMAGHEGKRVQVLLDETDLGTVYCYFEENSEYLCTAVNPELVGVDRYEMALLMKEKQREIYAEKRREARKLSRQLNTKDIHRDIMAYRKGQIAKVYDLPKRTEAYTTPVLEETAKAAEAVDRSHKTPQPIDITPEQESAAHEVISLEAHRESRGMPATEQECYDLLQEELEAGSALTVNDEQWMADWDNYLLTGEREGLLAAGYQPFAERRSRRRAAASE